MKSLVRGGASTGWKDPEGVVRFRGATSFLADYVAVGDIRNGCIVISTRFEWLFIWLTSLAYFVWLMITLLYASSPSWMPTFFTAKYYAISACVLIGPWVLRALLGGYTEITIDPRNGIARKVSRRFRTRRTDVLSIVDLSIVQADLKYEHKDFFGRCSPKPCEMLFLSADGSSPVLLWASPEAPTDVEWLEELRRCVPTRTGEEVGVTHASWKPLRLRHSG